QEAYSADMAYPAEPWSLRGRMYVSVFVLPTADVPALPAELSGTVRVVRLGGRAVVGSAWVDYRPGGDLSYRELLAAVLVRVGWAVEPGGPLAFLAGRRPLLSLVADDFRMRFGRGERSGRDTRRPSRASS